MAFPQTTLDVTVELQLSGVWTDITEFVYLREPLTITWGRQDWGARVTSGRCPMQINNRGGQFSIRNPHGPYYGVLTRNTPVRIYVTLDGGTVSYRFTGEIRAWPNRWDLSGKDRWVQVEAAGLLRRYEQGNKPLYDAMRRHIEASGPLAYWPLTDGETAIHGSEVIQGSTPMRAVGEAGSFYKGQPDWGGGTLAPWLDPVVELPDESIGRLSVNVPAFTVTRWAVDHAFAGGGVGAANTLEVWDRGARTDSEPQHLWQIVVDHLGDFVRMFCVSYGDSGSSSTLLANVSPLGIADGGVHHLRLVAVGDTTWTNWSLVFDGNTIASGIHTVTNYPVSRIVYRWGTVEGGGINTEAVALGHVTYWETPPPNAETHRALLGYNREPAGRRIERLCAEQNVPLQVTGSLDDTPPMGPQRSATFLEVLRTAEEVDGGVLGEARDTLALAYRTRSSKYNQGV